MMARGWAVPNLRRPVLRMMEPATVVYLVCQRRAADDWTRSWADGDEAPGGRAVGVGYWREGWWVAAAYRRVAGGHGVAAQWQVGTCVVGQKWICGRVGRVRDRVHPIYNDLI
jgi:hypothetical protein